MDLQVYPRDTFNGVTLRGYVAFLTDKGFLSSWLCTSEGVFKKSFMRDGSLIKTLK
jgi:hypothetical protein